MPRFALMLCALLIAGCGGDPKPKATGTDGKSLFAGTCGGCHTLQAAGTSGTFGPNLDELSPGEAQVAKAIAEGPGAMPDKLFEGAQADAVAKYVASAAGG